jgi:hypothetical protein
MQDIWQLLEQKQSTLATLQAELAAAESRYLHLKADSEASVHRWEWSSSLPRYELDPLYFLNDSSKRGRATKKQPQITKHKHQYGFDSSGRVVVERDHTEFPCQFYERFYLYSQSEIHGFLYHHSPSKDPINCSRLTLESGVPISFHSRAQQGSQSHVYIPQSGLIHYFCSLHQPDGREPFGGAGELSFTSNDTVKLLHRQPNAGLKPSFSGPRSVYNTLAGVDRDGR